MNSLLKSFSKYVSLNILGMLGLSCYILADTFFISNALGGLGLAALNFSIPVYSLISGTGLMLGMGGATRYSVLRAQGDPKSGGVFTNTLILGGLFSLLFILCGLFFATPIAASMGADASALGLTQTYLKTVLCFSPFFIGNNILLAFVRNDGGPKTSMAAMLAGSFANVILDAVFIYPMGMGMFGAAFATGLAPVVSLLVLSARFVRGKGTLRAARCGLRGKTVKSIFSLGLSSFITEVSSGVSMVVFNLVIMSIAGNTGVAAYGVVANLALVALSVYTGISQGMQPVVSRGYGAGRPTGRVLQYGLVLAAAFSLLSYGCGFLFAPGLTAVFNSGGDQALAAMAETGIRVYFAGFLPAGANIVAASYLSSREKASGAFAISILRGCGALIPAVLLLSALFGLGGVWASFILAEAVTCVASVLLLIGDSRRSRTSELQD